MDVLPERATKYHAVRFIMLQNGCVDEIDDDLPDHKSGKKDALTFRIFFV
jgi:hypothetical protein